MRIRPLAALSVAALSALVLVGCAGSATPEADPTATETAGGDLCAVAAPTGEVVESVTVEGEVGESATAEFTAPLTIESAERAVVVEGDGPAISDGDYVSYALAVFDATTGESVQEGGFGGTGLPAMPITLGSGADTFFGCATEGSRVVMTVPDSGNGAQVYVIDMLDVTPAAEWCAVAEPGADFPSVEFDGEGVPTVTIPDADAPDEVQLEVLEEGDGAVVEPGDSVTVNYTGVKWSDGTEFDSSYTSGQPATFSTTGVVTGFQRALEGQTVGSTVVVSMPPACGYGDAGSSSHELAGETLVFVVEIIEAAKPTE
ncbi:FKBP-type peptidyl-prolyl cis-trans isomerase [Microbacterium sp. CFBP9034]|uniref:FKBP-type peptidyl-prolyl cis-trans isomerase n=1 Tax=Microbacterium sp. CFBP9034 TaxID=3096540 RepID=UPI002A6ADD4E|nr:FKBP-type peptidyl-prolyl cis-trans isomerase [Microbacterium sp. CFBP9034]MDY0909150.1 FKBP-type peptidyl-prolyl cis-trans isomerase [Microbacterium sp. CFBP9034]